MEAVRKSPKIWDFRETTQTKKYWMYEGLETLNDDDRLKFHKWAFGFEPDEKTYMHEVPGMWNHRNGGMLVLEPSNSYETLEKIIALYKTIYNPNGR